MMGSTRLWLGDAVNPRRDRALIRRLVALVAACAQFGPLLFVSDSLSTYTLDGSFLDVPLMQLFRAVMR